MIKPNNVQVWDGYKFTTVSKNEANALVKAGTHQISTNLDGRYLKRPAEFMSAQVTEQPTSAPAQKVIKKRPAKRGKYKTRQMKAAT